MISISNQFVFSLCRRISNELNSSSAGGRQPRVEVCFILRDVDSGEHEIRGRRETTNYISSIGTPKLTVFAIEQLIIILELLINFAKTIILFPTLPPSFCYSRRFRIFPDGRDRMSLNNYRTRLYTLNNYFEIFNLAV